MAAGQVLSAGLATKLAASAIVVGGATGGGVALDTPKPPPRPPAARAVAPTPARTAVPPGPVVAVGERLERKVRVQSQRRGDKPLRKRRERAAARREQTATRRNEAVSRRDQALARRDEKLAARGAPGTRGRGNATEPVTAEKVPGSSRSPRAPAKKAHPDTAATQPVGQARRWCVQSHLGAPGGGKDADPRPSGSAARLCAGRLCL